MFEVGKTYTRKATARKYDCVYADEFQSVIKSDDGRLLVEDNKYFPAYKEYKEPKQRTVEMFLVENKDGSLSCPVYINGYTPNISKILARKPITITEGEGL